MKERNVIQKLGNVVNESWILFRLALDPTTDPIFVEYKRMQKEEKAGLIEPQTFISRLKSAVHKGGI